MVTYGYRLRSDESEFPSTLPWRRICNAVVRAMGWYYGHADRAGNYIRYTFYTHYSHYSRYTSIEQAPTCV